MKKGIALPVGGVLMIIISMIAVWLMTFAGGSGERYIIFKGELTTSLVNEAEFLRKMLDVGVKPIAERAAYELGQAGGGSEVWSKEGPKFGELKENLLEKIISMLPSGKMQGSDSNREIEWGVENIDIIKYNETPCGSQSGDFINSSCFFVNGNKTFVLTDDRIYATIISNASFNQIANSSYFKLISVGRKLFENESYKIAHDRVEWVVGNIGAANSNFSVNDSLGIWYPGCNATLNSSGYYDNVNNIDYLPISNLVNFSLWCGFEDENGLASLTDFSTEETDKIAINVTKALNDTLENFYGLDFWANATVISRSPLDIEILFNITSNSLAPLKEEEKELDPVTGKKIPLGNLTLKFKTKITE